MDISGVVVLVVGGAILGLIGQLIQGARFPYEWVATGIGAVVGGFIARELPNWAAGQSPEFGGLFVLPALVGGLVGGAIVWLVARNTGSAPVGHAT